MKTDEGGRPEGDDPAKRGAARRLLPVAAVIVAAFILAAGATALWNMVIAPKIGRPKSEVRYSLVRTDHTWVRTKPSGKMKGFKINADQYVMHGDDSECFSFTGDGASPRHTMRVTLAFGDAKSRNLLLQQQAPIRMAVKSGRITAQFCFVQTDNEYSVLATEALAESDYNDPSKTWDLMYELMMTDTSGFRDTAQRADAIASTVMKHGAARVQGKPEITAESITKGTFFQWSYMMSESQRAQYLPSVFVDGEPINGSVSIYNPDGMWKYLRSLPVG